MGLLGENKYLNGLLGVGEGALMVGSSIPAQIGRGYGEIYGLLSDQPDYGQRVQDNMTYQPRLESTQSAMQSIAPYVDQAGTWFNNQAVNVEQATGIPREAVLAGAEIGAELLPFDLATGSRAIKQAGRALKNPHTINAGRQIVDSGYQRMGGVGSVFESPMTAYHGSPYKFDRFDHSKMGTGEGAQAYGWGTYLAEDKGVGIHYMNMKNDYEVNGVRYKPSNLNPRKRWNTDDDYADVDDEIGLALYAAERDKDTETVEDFIIRTNYDDYYEGHKSISEILGSELSSSDMETALELANDVNVRTTKNLYEVDLPDEKIAQMLDWDKPLSEQPPAVQQVARDYNITRSPSGLKEARGSDIYRRISTSKQKPPFDNTTMNPGTKEGSAYLHSLGIPGIKYLDGSSRASGKGTRNFVVFDENDMNILTRNGKGLLDIK